MRDLCFCHCTSCRRAAGAPTVPWGTVDLDAFSLTQGALREFRSSPDVVRGFCSACGTSITYRREPLAELDFALAALDDPEALRPERHVWVEHKPSWVKIDDGLPQFARCAR